MHFRKYISDQCLLMREDDAGTVIICLYIDDTLIVGDESAIRKFKDEIEIYFTTKQEGEMTEYVGCKVKRSKNTILFHQTELVEKLRRNFHEKIKNLRNYKIPATPG